MKTINNLSDNQLRELFKNMHMDSPSENFTDSLFAKIEKEAAGQKLKKQMFTVIQLAFGIVCIFGLSGIAVYYSGFDMYAAIHRLVESIHINFNLVLYGIVILLLLICDTLINIRQHKHS